MDRSKRSGNGSASWYPGLWAVCVLALGMLGCEGGTPGNRNRVDDLIGGEFYRTAEMLTPRYEHQAQTMDDGMVFVVGGTDERCFTSIDISELFDQRLVVDPEPPSLSGGWIDTDFEGEELRLQDGGRIFHTVVRMQEGNVMIVGGATDGVLGEPYNHPEFYERNTRTFTVITAALEFARFHHTTVAVTEGEFLVIGGEVNVNMTIVNPEYLPSDPRFITQVNTNPSTNSIEIFDASIESDDGYGGFRELDDGNGHIVTLPGAYGRALHATVRVAGMDSLLENSGDSYISAGGMMTLSPMFAPQTKMRRLQYGQSELQTTMDVYDAASKSCFIAPGIFVEAMRAHGLMSENMGWNSDTTYDGYRGLSNTFLLFGGSDDTMPTWGRWLCEGFSVTYSGFGPGGGILFSRLEPQATDMLRDIIGDVLNGVVNDPVVGPWPPDAIFPFGNGLTPGVGRANGYPLLAPWPVQGLVENRIGKFFASELLPVLDTQAVIPPVNRVHTQAVRVRRSVYTRYGPLSLGNVFTGAGAQFWVTPTGAQVEQYEGIPFAAGEYFDPNFGILNGCFLPQRTPYDLDTMRTYWHVKLDVPLPTMTESEDHPNPTGIDGAWLITDGFIPGDGFEGYQAIPPDTTNAQDYQVRYMEKGRAWHTLSLVAGADGTLRNEDDRILFAGGGEGVAAWGGMPVTPSAILYVPSPSR